MAIFGSSGGGGGTVTGTGTANKVAKFTSASAIGDSNVTDDGTTVTSAKKVVVTPAADGTSSFVVNSAAASQRVVLGSLNATDLATYGTIWLGSDAPTSSNYVVTKTSGSDTSINAATGKNILLVINDSTGVKVDSSGNFITTGDNAHDLGASGATRFRTGYFGTSVVVPALSLSSATVPITFTNAAFQGCTSLGTSAGGVLTCTASSERLKENIEGYGDGLEQLRQVNPAMFTWREDSGRFDGGKKHLGVIAENLQTGNPLFASEFGEDGLLQPEQLALDAAEISAIKTLDALLTRAFERIEQLENQVAVLGGKKS